MGLFSKTSLVAFVLGVAALFVVFSGSVFADTVVSGSFSYRYSNGGGYNNWAGYCGNNYCEYGENALNCARDCWNPFGYHYRSACYLDSYQRTITAPGWSDIYVHYTDLFSSPRAVAVNCGNGYVAYGYNALGNSGTAIARCYFPFAGVFTQTAYAGGIGCSPSVVSVLPRAGASPSPTTPPANGGGSGSILSSCSAVANPSEIRTSGVSTVSIYYKGVTPISGSVSCGDPSATVKDAICADGVCTAQCIYNPSSLPYFATVDAALRLSSSESMRCTPTYVSVISPTVTPTPFPPVGGQATCAVITNPPALDTNGSSSVTVVYQNFGQNVSTAKIICGNGQESNTLCGNSQNGACNAIDCVYSTPSAFPRRYPVSAVANGVVCSASSVTLFGNNAVPTPVSQPTGGLVVIVTDSNSNPLQGSFVVVYANGVAMYSGTTDSAGTVSFLNVPVGTYTIVASKAGYQTASSGGTVTAGQTTTVTVVLPTAFASQSCTVGLNPSNLRPGDQTTVSVGFSGFPSAASAQVSCGGQVVQASCAGNPTGVCTAQCTFGPEQSYPQSKVVSASVNGVACNSASATLIAPVPTDGSLVARVTDCASGAALQSAELVVSTSQLFSDASGLAGVSLSPGVYTITSSKQGYSSSTVSASITAGATTSKAICLNKVVATNGLGGSGVGSEFECPDYRARLISAPMCPFSFTQQPYQVLVTNKNATDNNTIFVSYSTTALSGPQFVALGAGQQAILEFNSTLADVAGSRSAIVNFASTLSNCTGGIGVQACVSGGLEIEVPRSSLSALPGQRTCFDVLVRNHGLASGNVVLSYNSSDGNERGEFSETEFRITPQEIKQLQFCITPRSSGLKSFTLNADSALGDGSRAVTLDVVQGSQYSTNAGSCISIDPTTTTVRNVPITISNNGLAGDYDVELQSLEDENAQGALEAQVVQPKIYGFESQSSRDIFVRVNPFNANAGEHRFQLLLKKGGFLASQKDLCFDVEGDSRQDALLSPLSLTLQTGQSSSSFLDVENTGNTIADYSVVFLSSPLSVQASPRNFRLKPGERQVVEVIVSANTTPGSYTVPVRLVSSIGTTDATYDVSVNCGNGQTQTVTCSGGRNSCSTTCTYSSTGIFTPTASIAGQSCVTEDVRVVNNFDNSCYLSFSPQAMGENNYATVIANYQNLNSGQQDNFTIDCGNGYTETAQNCVGSTGSCSAQCYYDSDGTYTATATSQNYTCSAARIGVRPGTTGSSYCRISVQDNVLLGSSNTITLNYDVPTSGFFTGQSLLGVQNLLVRVVSPSTSFSPQTSGNIAVTVPSAIEVAPGSSVLLPVTVKNNDVFDLNTVLVYLTNLPTGVDATPVPAFALPGGSQVTRNIIITSRQDAPFSFSNAVLHVESSAFAAPAKTVFVNVKSGTAKELIGTAGQPSFEFQSQGNGTTIIVRLPFTNNQGKLITLGAFGILPQGWRLGFTPVSLDDKETTTLGFVLANDAYDDKAFDGQIRLQSSDGVKTIPISVPSRSSATGLSGLFTGLGSSPIVAILLILLIMGIAAAGYLYAESKKLERQMGDNGSQDGIQNDGKKIVHLHGDSGDTSTIDE